MLLCLFTGVAMMIFKNECRRILRPVIFILIAVVSILWYLTFMRYCNAYLSLNDGIPYAAAKEYLQRFGTTIDADEIEEIKRDQKAAKAALDSLIEQYMGGYGIHTMEEYENYSETYSDTFQNKKSEDYKNAISKWGEAEYNRYADIYNKVDSI